MPQSRPASKGRLKLPGGAPMVSSPRGRPVPAFTFWLFAPFCVVGLV